MPFNLRLRSVPVGDAVGWSMEGPSWLDGAPGLPADPALIRQFIDESYGRDRYLILSAEELMAWHMAQLPKLISRYGDRTLLPVDIERDLIKFESKVGRASRATIFVLHWYEWESGMN